MDRMRLRVCIFEVADLRASDSGTRRDELAAGSENVCNYRDKERTALSIVGWVDTG